jgi:hypothetical protein
MTILSKYQILESISGHSLYVVLPCILIMDITKENGEESYDNLSDEPEMVVDPDHPP